MCGSWRWARGRAPSWPTCCAPQKASPPFGARLKRGGCIWWRPLRAFGRSSASSCSRRRAAPGSTRRPPKPPPRAWRAGAHHHPPRCSRRSCGMGCGWSGMGRCTTSPTTDPCSLSARSFWTRFPCTSSSAPPKAGGKGSSNWPSPATQCLSASCSRRATRRRLGPTCAAPRMAVSRAAAVGPRSSRSSRRCSTSTRSLGARPRSRQPSRPKKPEKKRARGRRRRLGANPTGRPPEARRAISPAAAWWGPPLFGAGRQWGTSWRCARRRAPWCRTWRRGWRGGGAGPSWSTTARTSPSQTRYGPSTTTKRPTCCTGRGSLTSRRTWTSPRSGGPSRTSRASCARGPSSRASGSPAWAAPSGC
mmetsp:Transcript_38428/g.85806  ORF Transcript_38428/g.85806 Transcript_38428/m.85806 type:complete len:362 (+) Transcript_38428:490-1575(+)